MPTSLEELHKQFLQSVSESTTTNDVYSKLLNCFNKNTVKSPDYLLNLAVFFEMCGKGSTSISEFLERDKQYGKAKNYAGETAVHIACSEGHVSILKTLMTHGCLESSSLTIPDNEGYTPLKKAVLNGHTNILGYLKEVNVCETDLSKCAAMISRSHKVSILNYYASEGNTNALKRLVDAQYKLDRLDTDGRTALHVAAETGNTSTVIMLLSNDANPNLVDRWGNTPLDCAEANLHVSVQSVLRSKGGKHSEELSSDEFPSEQTNDTVSSPVQMTSRLGFTHEKFIKAAAGRKLSIMKSVLKGSPQLLNATDYDGRSALHLASEEGHLDVVQFLLAEGCDVNVKDRWGSTPFVGALHNTHNDIADCLLDNGAVQERSEPASCATYLRHAKDFFDSVAESAGLSPTDIIPLTALLDYLKSSYGLYLSKHAVLQKEVDELSLSYKSQEAQKILLHAEPSILSKIPDGRVVTWESFADFTLKDVPGYNPQGEREFEHDTNTLAKCVLKKLSIGKWEAFVGNLQQLVNDVLEGGNEEGETAQYVPELKNADPNKFAVSVCTAEGQRCHFGDTDTMFPVQSVGKTFAYSQALSTVGVTELHKHVGQEPSGRSFNDFALTKNGVPYNPVTNSGAIVTCSMLNHAEPDLDNRLFPYKQLLSDMSGGLSIGDCMDVYHSEQQCAFRNYALANHMKAEGVFPDYVNTHDKLSAAVNFYLRVCSTEVSTPILANIAATYANYGVCPLNGKTCLRESEVKQTLQILSSCGMYDYSGEWACTIGMPAKSGVSGAIFVVIPGVLGMSVFSPRLDEIGNSVRGIKFCEAFSEKFRFSNLDLLLRQADNV
eukprot:TRINITY_DN15584_c0_g1_i1.p1 TRINITY_DN15584_c0_g1~~TRINITY_DN15584_c0_g1_i1.p1  ORF type:complete len:835 (+),score=185.37 TRINITY_DN15584_c0_g1_i1:75-2579(+)